MTNTTRRLMRGVGLLCAAVLGTTACGGSGGDDSGGEVSASDVRAALEKGGSITVWAWEPTLEQVAADFEEKYPKVDVELVNAGTGNDHYTALQNAMSAGSGVPDVAQIEYFALGQFALTESVHDLAAFGADEFDGTFSPGPWNAVRASGGVHALPMDSGPMALFYNKDVFDEHGVEVPTTWDEYVDAARALHEADPDVYIANDTGDPGLATSLIWQAGGRPYRTDGTDVTIDFTDEGTTAYTGTWQKLLDEDLLAPVTSWSDEWYQGLSDGTIATLAAGAWMPANFESGVPKGSGSWRVAPLPQWKEGASDSAENGGSGLALPTAGENRELAYAFARYATTGDGVRARVDAGAFPATTEELESEEFLGTEFDYFGGQKANEIFAESSANVSDGWSYLPYQVYANSVFNDTVGKAYVSDEPLAEGLKAWQRSCVEYGREQGFTVNE
ncbi:extracellular solute-binding protein [Streptomyces sp. TRM43335]|uniref:Extracellular solute-binding protein n=1 Tax=Streptomyces taklimakanensis TaxID=2569853 RepID=A0A6G2B7M7_9ACTN|nr:extracellular solute-binding protein [Streptomyces taklimakanensis]MTE17912.1 extracellular solute-binding protein [Streptomyces taklimakanensis]